MSTWKRLAALAVVLIVLAGLIRSRPQLGRGEPIPETAPFSDVIEEARLTVGPTIDDNACTECHTQSTRAWKRSQHFIGYLEMHRSELGQQIAANLGTRSIKRNALCQQCHYTSILEGDNVRALWGVSCESCHGPARHWVEVHNTVGGELGARTMSIRESRRIESPEQRKMRLDKAAAHGMVHSDRLYELAVNCMKCHAVPNEGLINVGGHPINNDFELVAWSQGEVRHNFVRSSDRDTNAALEPERERRLYITGLMVDLEFTLRNLAAATRDGPFKTQMLTRASRLRARAEQVFELIELPEFAEVFEQIPFQFTPTTWIDPSLPEQLGAATRAFLAHHDGSKLGAIDTMLPGPGQFKGRVYTP